MLDAPRRAALSLAATFAALAALAGPAASQGRPREADTPDRLDATRVTLSDDRKVAVKELRDWLAARGYKSKASDDGRSLQYRKGLIYDIQPFVFENELDRLLFVSLFRTKEAMKGSDELKEFVLKANLNQNFYTVFIATNGNLGVNSHLTFTDELTAHHFDLFVDTMTAIIRRNLLGAPEAKTLLD